MEQLTQNDKLAALVLNIFYRFDESIGVKLVHKLCKKQMHCHLNTIILICEELCSHSALEPMDHAGYYHIRKEGIRIVSFGGWEKFAHDFLQKKQEKLVQNLAAELVDHALLSIRMTSYAARSALILAIVALVWNLIWMFTNN